MRFAYADPPYLGCCSLYEHHHEDPYGCWDELGTHADLIDDLCYSFPDGWAMSASSPSLRSLLPLCPDDVRTLAWVKPFAAFKPNVGVAYAWEPVILRGGRRRTREQDTARDWHAKNITLQRGFTGAKPAAVIHWICDVLNVQPGDEMVDLFPGSGGCTEAIDGYLGRTPIEPGSLFGEVA